MPDAHSANGHDSWSAGTDLIQKAMPETRPPLGDLEQACAVTSDSSINEWGQGQHGGLLIASGSAAVRCFNLQGRVVDTAGGLGVWASKQPR